MHKLDWVAVAQWVGMGKGNPTYPTLVQVLSRVPINK